MESIDKKYRKVRAFLDILNKINKEFIEEEAVGEDYYSPFHESYQLERVVSEIWDKSVEFVVEKERSANCPNISVNLGKIKDKLIKKYGVLGFSSIFIKNYIKTHYLKKSDKLSYEEILQEARKTLPVIWADYKRAIFGRKKMELDDIWEKDKLILKVYRGTYTYENQTMLGAIEKLTKIVIEGESPTTVKAGELSGIFSSRNEEVYRTHQIYGKNIVKARPYKNGKFLLWFKDEKTAKKVGKALIRG